MQTYLEKRCTHKPIAPAENSRLNSILGLKVNFTTLSKITLVTCYHHTCTKSKTTSAKMGGGIIKDLKVLDGEECHS